MVALCHFRTEYDERIIETSVVGVWIEWPPFDVYIHTFEVGQWLNTCDIDFGAYRALSALAPKFKENTLQRTIVAKTNKE